MASKNESSLSSTPPRIPSRRTVQRWNKLALEGKQVRTRHFAAFLEHTTEEQCYLPTPLHLATRMSLYSSVRSSVRSPVGDTIRQSARQMARQTARALMEASEEPYTEFLLPTPPHRPMCKLSAPILPAPVLPTADKQLEEIERGFAADAQFAALEQFITADEQFAALEQFITADEQPAADATVPDNIDEALSDFASWHTRQVGSLSDAFYADLH